MKALDIERRQEKLIEDAGLVREITHVRKWVAIDGHKLPIYWREDDILVIGKTVVTLHDMDEHQRWIENKKESKVGIVAEGVSLCSAKDNYNKKIGRVIATSRAIKSITE